MEDFNTYIILLLTGIIIGGLIITMVLFSIINRTPYSIASSSGWHHNDLAYRSAPGTRLVATLVFILFLYLLMASKPSVPNSPNIPKPVSTPIESIK